MQASGAVVVAGLALLGAAAAVFRAGKVDPEAETVVWPNVADVAPEVWQRGFPEGQPADEPADSAT